MLVREIVVSEADISHPRDGDGLTCKLQRIYLQRNRGLDMTVVLLQLCLQVAREFGYHYLRP